MYQPPFEVHLSCYGSRVFVASSHRSMAAACRALASAIGGRKHRIKDLETALIWCARDNHAYALVRARELLAAGHFDGPAYR